MNSELARFAIYAIAVIGAAVVGHYFVKWGRDPLLKYARGRTPKREWGGLSPTYPELPKWMGVLERVMYTGAWLLGFYVFIAVWLPLKVAGGWGDWQVKGEVSRAKFTIMLFGTGLSLMISVTFAELAKLVIRYCLPTP